MLLARWVPPCPINKSEDQSTHDDTEDEENFHKRATILVSATLSRTIKCLIFNDPVTTEGTEAAEQK